MHIDNPFLICLIDNVVKHMGEGFFLEEKIKELLEHYELDIAHIYRGRGAWICHTDQGCKLIREYKNAPLKLEGELEIKKKLRERGFFYIDQIIKNKEGALYTKDEEGVAYIVTDWYEGKECSTRDSRDILRAVATMAGLHRVLSKMQLEPEIHKSFQRDNVQYQIEKRMKEFRTIRNYIGHKGKKNMFDRRFMEVYEGFYIQGEEAKMRFLNVGYNQIYKKICEEEGLCHGAMNQHNICMCRDFIAILRFDQMHFEIPIYDLYVFMRKILEKNHWNQNLGKEMITTYHQIRAITSEEYEILYAMFLFPEKLWKIGNRYHNTRKSWLSMNNMDKLEKVIREREERNHFLEMMSKFCPNTWVG